MRYDIYLADSALDDLRRMRARDRSEIRDAIERYLRTAAERTSRSRIRRLRGLNRPMFRLRVGDFRVYYDVDGATVDILAVLPKLDSERWLHEHGEPQ
jgi:mRNA-degrading endonuclease RelE of RelBE toxin-antitoxin system